MLCIHRRASSLASNTYMCRSSALFVLWFLRNKIPRGTPWSPAGGSFWVRELSSSVPAAPELISPSQALSLGLSGLIARPSGGH